MLEITFLRDVLIFLVAAMIVVSLFRPMRASPVLGYLVAGALIGPYGLGIITDVEATQGLAKLGVVFLLFTVGLEFSFARLKVMRLNVFGLGTAQLVACGLALGAVAWILGLEVKVSILIGAALALSSTAMVLQLINERGEMASHAGRISLAILLLQDLAVVPLLVLVPLLGQEQATVLTALGLAAFKAVVALAVILVLGRLLVEPLFRAIAAHRSPELLAGLSLLVVLGLSWATEQAGLSLILGAFLAGLLLAETEFRHQVEADILPFRGILIGLFFMTVGMKMDLRLTLDEALALFAVVAGIIVVKTVIIAAVCRLFGHSTGFSLHQGLLLSQGGEFAFILFGLASSFAVLPPEAGQILILAVAVTMALTPLLAVLGKRLADAMEHDDWGGIARLAEEATDVQNHVLVAGFGRVGQTVARLLTAHQIPYIALDLAPRQVAQGRRRGLAVYYGDASQRNVLQAAGADRARAAAITMNDPRAAARAVALLRQSYPDLEIFVRARDHRHGAELQKAGATAIVPEAVE
ncbi:MAG: monovalent cation:proton antiporter-2 (CPA2) family protein, partial [Alphaproteobacteria bacterium]